ncbi:polysaccharide biosynthesis protein, partial [Elioraea sp. Yellowstone]
MAILDRLRERLTRSQSIVAADAGAAFLSWPMALLLADPAALAARPPAATALEAGGFALLAAVVLLAARVPRIAWRYVGPVDLARTVGAASAAALLFGLVLAAAGRLGGFTPLLPVLHALTVSALLAGARGAYRAAVQHGAAAGEAIPV